jgi:large subunit ribosomal protein L33
MIGIKREDCGMWRRSLLFLFLALPTATVVRRILICYNFRVMAKKGDKRKIIGLICEVCNQRHYYSTKNTMNTPDKIELIKYCPVKRVQAKQVETKKSLGRNEVKPRR